MLAWYGGFPCGSVSKKSACNARDPGMNPGSGRSLEKEMATHSSILAWRIPWTEEPGGPQSIELQRVRHDWSDWAHTQHDTSFPDLLIFNLYLSLYLTYISYRQHRVKSYLFYLFWQSLSFNWTIHIWSDYWCSWNSIYHICNYFIFVACSLFLFWSSTLPAFSAFNWEFYDSIFSFLFSISIILLKQNCSSFPRICNIHLHLNSSLS